MDIINVFKSNAKKNEYDCKNKTMNNSNKWNKNVCPFVHQKEETSLLSVVIKDRRLDFSVRFLWFLSICSGSFKLLFKALGFVYVYFQYCAFTILLCPLIYSAV